MSSPRLFGLLVQGLEKQTEASSRFPRTVVLGGGGRGFLLHFCPGSEAIFYSWDCVIYRYTVLRLQNSRKNEIERHGFVGHFENSTPNI